MCRVLVFVYCFCDLLERASDLWRLSWTWPCMDVYIYIYVCVCGEPKFYVRG